MSAVSRPRSRWRTQLGAIVVLALLGTVPFWLGNLDTAFSAQFYHPGAAMPWPLANAPHWLLLYQAAPVIIGLLAGASLLLIGAATLWPWLQRWRLYALFVLLTGVLGPGVVVNLVFKDHWGHPRPHQTLQLGGVQAYVPPLALGDTDGKSFPAGHASAGFLIGAFYLIWQRRRPWLARASLVMALLTGSAIGTARILAGDHFLSDVIWSAVLTGAVALLVYYWVLRVPQREAAARRGIPKQPPALATRWPLFNRIAYGLIAGLLLFAVLLATPVHQNSDYLIRPATAASHGRTLIVTADQANTHIHWRSKPKRAARLALRARGYGLPGTRVEAHTHADTDTYRIHFAHQGIYTERDTNISLDLDPEAWKRVEISLERGDIRVDPAPTTHPRLHLNSNNGTVMNDAGGISATAGRQTTD